VHRFGRTLNIVAVSLSRKWGKMSAFKRNCELIYKRAAQQHFQAREGERRSTKNINLGNGGEEKRGRSEIEDREGMEGDDKGGMSTKGKVKFCREKAYSGGVGKEKDGVSYRKRLFLSQICSVNFSK